MTRPAANCYAYLSNLVHQLPDGRHLVHGVAGVKIVDQDGSEFAPSPAEIAALLALTEMSFPQRKDINGRKLIKPYIEDEPL